MINLSCLFWQDVREFRLLLASVEIHNHELIVCAECFSNLEKATALYRGSFLEGLNLRDSPEFDQWQYLQRENALLEFTSSLEKLTLAYASFGERRILQLLVEGCSNREIAERLVLSEGTIKFHIHNILGKLNATSRIMAIIKARELNLI